MSEIFQNIIAVPLGIGLLIIFVYYRLFELLVQIAYFVLAVSVLLAWMLIKRIPRVLAFIIWAIALPLLFLATLPASIVGTSVKKSKPWFRDKSRAINPNDELHLLRETFVEILAKQEDRDDHLLDTEEEYRERIGTIPDITKARLETGEMIISIIVAGGVLLAQFQGVSFIHFSFGTVSVMMLIQLYLLLLAVSILYRVTLLDIASYDGTENLDGREQWNAAYRFQSAIAFQSKASILILLMAGATMLVRTDYGVIDYALRESIEEDRSDYELCRDVWNKLRSEQD